MSTRIKSCGSVVFKKANEVEYLLLQGGSLVRPFWDFSKGEVDNGETETDTALRELKEETGITDVRLIEGFREEIHYFSSNRAKPHSRLPYFIYLKLDKKKLNFHGNTLVMNGLFMKKLWNGSRFLTQERS